MVDGSDFVTGSGSSTSINAVRLVSVILGAIVFAVGAGMISLFQAIVEVNIRAINAAGGFSRELIAATLGESAAVIVEGWRVGAVSAMQFGPAAPWIVAVEALIVLAIGVALWQRRPYS